MLARGASLRPRRWEAAGLGWASSRAWLKRSILCCRGSSEVVKLTRPTNEPGRGASSKRPAASRSLAACKFRRARSQGQ